MEKLGSAVGWLRVQSGSVEVAKKKKKKKKEKEYFS